MFNVHQDALMIPVSLTNLYYTEGKDSLPAISVSASRDKQGIIHISLVNIDPGKINLVRIQIQGGPLKLGNNRILQSARIQDHNSFDDPEKILPQSFHGVTINNNELNISMPPASVVVLTLI
jgi:alpha-N-arabinofuranosidase